MTTVMRLSITSRLGSRKCARRSMIASDTRSPCLNSTMAGMGKNRLSSRVMPASAGRDQSSVPQLDGQKYEGFNLSRGVMSIHRDGALPFGQAGNLLPGELEQERTAAPAGNLGLVPVESVRIRDIGEEFIRRVAEVGGMLALIAQLGKESGRGIFQ
ncbi:MAG: hypothetical protein MZV65_36255 [Chromatiales bacterium]|nr:hypothetical protein [Chromatiales bacterium]